MKGLTFYGYSDDNFAYDLDGEGCDEIGCYDSPAVWEVKTPSGEGLLVVGHYAPLDVAGCWSVGLSQLDEDVPLPNWDISFGWEGYSVRISMVVPNDAEVTAKDKKQDAAKG
jgi:hypothetical protein